MPEVLVRHERDTPPGLLCPECGKDARREARLFKARRRKLFVAASLVPLLAGLAASGVWFGRDGEWVRAMPTTVLILASPWQNSNSLMGSELSERIEASRKDDGKPLTALERSLAGYLSRREVSAGDDPMHVVFHIWILIALGENDEATRSKLVEFAGNSSPNVPLWVPGLFEQLVKADPASAGVAEEVLTTLIENPQRQVQRVVIDSLLVIKRIGPGGPAPAIVLADAADSSDLARMARACGLLGLYDPSEESRAALLAATTAPHLWARARAVGSLTRHAPDDPRVRELLIEAVRDPMLITPPADARGALVRLVLDSDKWFVDGRGELSERRRALYSDEVRAAILEAEAKAPVESKDWDGARELLRKHPCFTDAERARVRDPAEPGLGATPR